MFKRAVSKSVYFVQFLFVPDGGGRDLLIMTYNGSKCVAQLRLTEFISSYIFVPTVSVFNEL